MACMTTRIEPQSAGVSNAAAEFGEWMRSALTQLCVTGEYTDPDRPLGMDDVFAPQFSERTNGQELSLDVVRSNITRMRDVYTEVDITMVRVLREGDRYAMQYRMCLTSNDGSSSTIEAHQFGETDAGGRLMRIDEHVEQIAPLAADGEVRRSA